MYIYIYVYRFSIFLWVATNGFFWGVQTSKPGLLVHTLVISKRPELRIPRAWMTLVSYRDSRRRSLKMRTNIHRFHVTVVIISWYAIARHENHAKNNCVCVLKQHMETK